MKTAEEIKQEMREATRAHNEQVAQRVAQQALDELRDAMQLSKLNYAIAKHVSRDEVEALLNALEPYLTLLAEVAPTLPTEQQIDAPYRAAAEAAA